MIIHDYFEMLKIPAGSVSGECGISFAVAHGVDRDSAIRRAIDRRKSGGEFLTAEQSLANMRAAIIAGAERGIWEVPYFR
jgi:hypothetical protein